MIKNTDELENLSCDDLIQLWRTHFQHGPPKVLSAPMMQRFLAFEIQSHSGGGLSARAKRTIKQLQKPKQIGRLTSPQIQTGSQLIREWNGVTHKVEVLDRGFKWQGARYRSLSAIAKAITGAHWSGPRFFGFHQKQGEING